MTLRSKERRIDPFAFHQISAKIALKPTSSPYTFPNAHLKSASDTSGSTNDTSSIPASARAKIDRRHSEPPVLLRHDALRPHPPLAFPRQDGPLSPVDGHCVHLRAGCPYLQGGFYKAEIE
jgi:hypothetical protein